MSGSAPAFIAGGETVTYETLEERVRASATGLRALGVRPGDRVALRAANGPDWIVLAHAIWRAAGTIVPLSTRLTPSETADPLARARGRLLLADAPLPSMRPSGPRIVPLDALRGARPSPDPRPPRDSDDLDRERTVLFTSGTSGQPKGTILTWRNHVASARASAAFLPLGPGDRWLASLPFFHIGGLNIIHRCALSGACVILPDSLAAEDLNRAIDGEGVTHASFVETLLRRVLAAREGRAFPAALRAIVVGGGAVSKGTLDACPQALASYGLTESCSMATLVPPGAPEGVRRTSGLPLPGIEVRIAADGRIEIRGEVVMRGYLDDAIATREALRDGWLRTGDIGEIDDAGALRVLARREDLIVSGGENIYPAEIEGVLRGHPDVMDAVVIGIPDPEWGEVPLALVVGRSRATAGILPFLRERLAGYKIPRIVGVDSIPLLPNGKPDRAALRARYVPLKPPAPPTTSG